MAYATVAEVAAGFRPLETDEQSVCTALLDEAAIIIDDYNSAATTDNKKLVSCRMVRRAIGSGQADAFPLGATQGTVAALGYSQSWTMSNGSTGELYLSRMEKTMLGASNKIGSYSPTEELTT